jgi:hypothetical protein
MDNRKLRLTNRVCGSREILHLWRFRCVDCCFGWRCFNFKAMTLACRTRCNCSSSSSSKLDHSLCYVCVCLSPTKRTARALRPSRQESQTAQRRPHGSDIDSSLQSCIVRAVTLRVSARWSTSSLSLSLKPFLAPCACSVSALLQFSSELHCQSCNAQSSPLPSKTLRGTPSLLAVSVWPLRERLGQSTVIVTVNRYRSAQAVAARECFTNVCRMFWQGALPRKFANFKMQNDECHN